MTKNMLDDPRDVSSGNLVAYTVMFTSSQIAGFERLTKVFGAESVSALIERLLMLGKIVGDALDTGKELMLVKTALVEIVEKGETSRDKVVALIGKPENLTFVTEELKSLVGFEQTAQATNLFGQYPTQYKA